MSSIPLTSTVTDLGDPVALTQALVRCPSITPRDEGALDTLQGWLEALGFTCHRLPFSAPGTASVDNLYARRGSRGPHLCFAGHTDVVPIGRPDGWSVDPFAAVIEDGAIVGRGTADMKGAIAAWVAALHRLTAENDSDDYSVSLLITGDEEGPAINGTAKVLDWMIEQGEKPDFCLVGEPTNPSTLGEMVKIGRRGSMNARLTVHGHQGHVAYPHLADNPIPKLMRLVQALIAEPLDEGTDHFQPSNLEVTSVDVGNHAHNVIPGTAEALFNVRFNDRFSPQSLEAEVRRRLDGVGVDYDVDISVSGDSFVTPPGPLSDAIVNAVEARTGKKPSLSTTGGTSDARFIKNLCPVAEFGLVGASMHKVNEHVMIDDLHALTDVYHRIMRQLLIR